MPQAVEEIYDCLETKPSAVMICLTCVDALLGTDMERICKKAQKSVGIPVLPCYMMHLQEREESLRWYMSDSQSILC